MEKIKKKRENNIPHTSQSQKLKEDLAFNCNYWFNIFYSDNAFMRRKQKKAIYIYIYTKLTITIKTLDFVQFEIKKS